MERSDFSANRSRQYTRMGTLFAMQKIFRNASNSRRQYGKPRSHLFELGKEALIENGDWACCTVSVRWRCPRQDTNFLNTSHLFHVNGPEIFLAIPVVFNLLYYAFSLTIFCHFLLPSLFHQSLKLLPTSVAPSRSSGPANPFVSGRYLSKLPEAGPQKTKTGNICSFPGFPTVLICWKHWVLGYESARQTITLSSISKTIYLLSESIRSGQGKSKLPPVAASKSRPTPPEYPSDAPKRNLKPARQKIAAVAADSCRASSLR